MAPPRDSDGSSQLPGGLVGSLGRGVLPAGTEQAEGFCPEDLPFQVLSFSVLLGTGQDPGSAGASVHRLRKCISLV